MTHCKRLFINGQVVEVVFVPDEADPSPHRCGRPGPSKVGKSRSSSRPT